MEKKRRKKHDHAQLVKYMRMLEEGKSINQIHVKYGIDKDRLSVLWAKYQTFW